MVELGLPLPIAPWLGVGFEATSDASSQILLGETHLRFDAHKVTARIRSDQASATVTIGEIDFEFVSNHKTETLSPQSHPNGVTAIDHVVLLTPDLDAAIISIEALGLELRRVRQAEVAGNHVRQAFFRMGSVILEVVWIPAIDPTGELTFYGLALLANDLDQASSVLGDHISPVRPAIQKGMRIATLRAQLGCQVAIMDNAPKD